MLKPTLLPLQHRSTHAVSETRSPSHFTPNTHRLLAGVACAEYGSISAPKKHLPSSCLFTTPRSKCSWLKHEAWLAARQHFLTDDTLQKEGWLFPLIFVEFCPEEQQDEHDLVVCELCTLPAMVGERPRLCHVSLTLVRIFSHLIAPQRIHVPKQCVWWRAGAGSQVDLNKAICPVYMSWNIRAVCCHFPWQPWAAGPVLPPETFPCPLWLLIKCTKHVPSTSISGVCTNKPFFCLPAVQLPLA